MNIYVGTLGELIIVEIFVFYIWLRVLVDALMLNDRSLSARKLLLTSIGLVLNAIAIAAIMVLRLKQFSTFGVPTQNFAIPITISYIVLALGNICFIISAAIGQTPRLIRTFALVTVLWTGLCVYLSYFY